MSVSKDYEKALQKNVRKDKGIFYTKKEIANYISRKSIDYWLEENPNQLKSIKILDPSCGTGIFLLACFEYLVELYRKEFPNSTTIEKEILENNLFGVDIDKEALAILQEEFRQKTNHFCKNIKHGNSLISDKTISNFAFDWKKEFLHGFDVIVGNPPYVSHERIEHKNYLQKNYQTFEAFGDLYILFYEKAISLLNLKGVLSFITSNSFLKAEYGSSLRNLILENHYILQLINLEGSKIFEDATVSPIILISKEKTAKQPQEITVLNHYYSINNAISFASFVKENQFYYPATQTNFWTLKSAKEIELLTKIKGNHKTLEDYQTKIRLGIATGANDVFIIDEEKRQEFLKKNFKNDEIIKPVLRGRDINRYSYEFSNLYILLTPNEIDVKNNYPDIYTYLDSFDDNFKNRGAKGRHWTNLRATSFLEDFKEEKIIWIELSDKGRFALCKEEIYLLNSAYFLIVPKEFESNYILAILNSKLIQFYLKSIANTSGAGTSRWINQYVKSFPIPFIPLENQKEIKEKVTQLVEIQSKIEKQNKGFIQLLKNEFEEKINVKKLEKWSELKSKSFINELEKKNDLTLKQKKEWQEFFEEEQKSILPLYKKLNQLDSQIDNLIFELYQINKKEKQIIFDSLSQ